MSEARNKGPAWGLPDDALPEIEDLSGDLALLADIVVGFFRRAMPGAEPEEIRRQAVRLGLELAREFSGTAIRLWGYDRWLRRWRNHCIRRDADAGMTGVDLARKYGISDRHVWNVLGEPDEGRATRQRKLF